MEIVIIFHYTNDYTQKQYIFKIVKEDILIINQFQYNFLSYFQRWQKYILLPC